MDNAGYVLAGYLLTAAALAAYTGGLLSRVRRAGRRTSTQAHRRA